MTNRTCESASFDGLTVGEALAQHYLAQGLPPDGGASNPWFRVHIGPVNLRLPNPPARRRAVFFHDVNHIATGYNTKFGDGEMAIAAFEVGAGCGHFGIVWFINLSMFALGLLFRPFMVFRAFVRGRHSVSIYRDPPVPTVVATMTIADMRRRLHVDAGPLTTQQGDYLGFAVWGLVSLVMLVAPLALVLGTLWLSLRAWAP